MERKKNYIIIIAAAFCIIIFSGNIYNSVQYFRYRGLCNQYRKQLIAAEETNKELTDRIERVAEITGRIKETTDANITDARGIIETVERLRAEIQELEDCCGSFDQFEYYQFYDSYYRNEGLMD